MGGQGRGAWIRFVLKRLVVIEVLIVLAVLSLCTLAGWHSANEISLALLVAGVIVFAIGPFSMMGGITGTRSAGYQYAQTMNPDSLRQRMQRDQEEIGRSMGLIVPSVVIGLITMGLAVLVQAVVQ